MRLKKKMSLVSGFFNAIYQHVLRKKKKEK